MLLAHYNSIQPLIHTCGLHIILQTEHCTASLSMSLPSFQHQREGQGGGREKRTGSLSSLQLLLWALVWFSLLVRIHFHNRQQVGAVSISSKGLGGCSSGQPPGNNTAGQGASSQLGAVRASRGGRKGCGTIGCQHPWQSWYVNLCMKNKENCWLLIFPDILVMLNMAGLPWLFLTLSAAVATRSLFFPTLTALLQLSRGAGPGRQDGAPLFVQAVPEPSSQAADLPRCPGTGYDLQSRSPPERDGNKWHSKQLPSKDIFHLVLPELNKKWKARHIILDLTSQPVSWLFSQSRGNVLF